MIERNGGSPIPTARRSGDAADRASDSTSESPSGSLSPAGAVGVASPARTHAGAARSAGRSRLTWDIPWLGGRSTAPWVVLATVLILVVATIGALYAKQRPDRLGWTTTTAVVRDDSAVEFSFSVYKAPKAVAACDIVAADHNGGVGTLRGVLIPARTDGLEDTPLTVTVPTTRRADTAILEGCRIVSAG